MSSIQTLNSDEISSSSEKNIFSILPLELISEIAKYLQLQEYNLLLVTCKKLQTILTSDICYSNFYKIEIKKLSTNYFLLDYESASWKNPIYLQLDSIYSNYKNINSDYRNELKKLKMEISQNRTFNQFNSISNYYTVEESLLSKFKNNINTLKAVCVGTGGAGKTSFLLRTVSDRFDEWSFYIHDNIVIRYKQLYISLWDTAGQQDYDRLRPLSYPGTHLILLCFSLIDRRSFNDLIRKWIFEIRFHLPNSPIILIGCKYDLIEFNNDYITHKEGEEMAKYLKCLTYWECSAKTGYGMEYCKEIISNGCLHAILNGCKIIKEKSKCLIQ